MIGLGRMGGPMADHVVGAGHDVRVHDVVASAMEARAPGAVRCESPAQAARSAGVVGIVVFDDAQAVEVVEGPGGVLETLEPGAVVVVHTTVRLGTIRELARSAEACGVHLLDAGISGGEAGAADGSLVTMVGGAAEGLEEARPVLEAFSKEIVHAGPLGAGMALKLARNATGYALMATVHEAMTMAAHSGVDPQLLRHVIAETGVLDQGMTPFVLGGPDPLPADDVQLRPTMEHLLRLAVKDLDGALGLAAELGDELPVMEATLGSFARVTRLAP